ncbi:MAG: CHAD domain-containing protein, partial [Kiritimatiellae bacterium]|nr:CHAD domain-containing protein [Kiritimatiellia bacterium]
MKTATPEQLLRKNRAEHEHARHVAHLCDTLFDAFAEYAHFTPGDKKILHAAGLLHDVGYASNPAKHVEASVRILQQTPLRGFTKNQREILAAVVYLHRRNFKPILKKNELTRLTNPIHAMQLAALLCIADGLDHSHVQDCTIQRITHRKNTFTIWIHSAWYPGNATWALAKTALFSAVFDAELQFREKKRAPSSMRYHGLLQPDDTALESFRTLLYSQYRIYIDNLEGACEGADSRYLHDLRVALRRARMLFTWFKPILREESLPQTHRLFLTTLIRDLGHARDFQVWIDFIRSAPRPIKPSDQKKWRAFCEAESKKNRLLIRESGKLLKAPATTRNNRSLAHCLRSTLPALTQAQ